MLSKRNRFTRAEFDAFTSQSGVKTVYNRLGTLQYVSTGHHFAVVTSGKHEKRAVARNRLRRRLYDRFRSTDVALSGILRVSKQSYTLELSELRSLLDSLLSHAVSAK
jgi:ribonuclease P protein component